MWSIRRQIRERAATLVTGLTTTGARVFQSSVYPLDFTSPSLVIYTPAEAHEPTTVGHPRALANTLTLVIEGLAKAVDGVDDTLDAISSEVVAAMSADPKLAGLCHDCFLSGTQIAFSGEGSQPIGSIRMEYTVTYMTPENNNQTLR